MNFYRTNMQSKYLYYRPRLLFDVLVFRNQVDFDQRIPLHIISPYKIRPSTDTFAIGNVLTDGEAAGWNMLYKTPAVARHTK